MDKVAVVIALIVSFIVGCIVGAAGTVLTFRFIVCAFEGNC